jgi:hypothetical protein
MKLLWKGDQEVVKRSGRHEPIWAVIHMCMEATLGISLYIYLYLKLEKHCVFLIIPYAFSSIKLENQRGSEGMCRQTMYTHVSKCKNEKIK